MRDKKCSAECEKDEIYVSKMLKNDRLEKINYIQDNAEYPSTFLNKRMMKKNNDDVVI